MEQQTIDPKVVEKVHKLLALARDGGATEGEANNAMEMAQRIMLQHNLSMATIEQAGGASEDKRVKDAASGEGNRSWAQYRWQRDLMAEIGRVNFCYVSLKWGRTTGKGWKGKERVVGYNIIGRQSNVVAAKEMFTYLITTINRLIIEHNGGDHRQSMSKYSNSWKEGCADRLRERLSDRHKKLLDEQKREANERNARARHPAAATGTALVVVMEDFQQAEEDANNDIRFHLEPGTTAQRRREENARALAREEEKRQQLAAAKEAGATDRELATMRFYDCSLEQARLLIEKIDNPKEDKRTEAQKRKDEERERKQQERWDRQYERQRQRERDRLDPRGYRAGAVAADNIGLDPQIGRTDHRKLT